MIVKCQHSLETTCEKPQMLFYNWNRTWTWSGDVDDFWSRRFKDRGPKFFAKVKLHGELAPIFLGYSRNRNW